MTGVAPVDADGDLLRLLQGASQVMGGLRDLVAEIETDALGVLGSKSTGGSAEEGMQKIDLLLQSLGEMQRLLDRAPEKIGAANGYRELVSDIRLEQLRATFDRGHPERQFKLPGSVKPAITIFD